MKQIEVGTRTVKIDLRIQKGRGNLYSLLGPAFAYKWMLSPLVKIHLFRTFTCPIIRSGLYSFAQGIPTDISHFPFPQKSSEVHSPSQPKCTPTPAIHFLLGELPMEGRIHRDMFSLLYGVWCNPDTKIPQIVKYLLQNSSDSRGTWVINLRHIFKIYLLEDPLSCLERTPLENCLTRS